MPLMLCLILSLWGLIFVQDPAAATFISATELEGSLKQSIADKVIDRRLKSTPIPSAHSMLRTWSTIMAEAPAAHQGHQEL